MEERFFRKIIKEPQGCWIWTSTISKTGYGLFFMNGTQNLAHRISYQIMKGSIPAGKDLDHLCKVRHCVNPDHLEPVTHRENILRGDGIAAINSRKTHCIKGHPFNGDNLIKLKSTKRMCRKCAIERKRIKRLTDGIIPRNTRTHCKRGHDLTGKDAIYLSRNGTHRRCRVCIRIYTKHRWATQGK